MYIYSKTAAGLLFMQTDYEPTDVQVLNSNGQTIPCPILAVKQQDGGWQTILDAGNLEFWHPEHPTLYTVKTNCEAQRFGHTSVTTFQNKQILLNDAPLYVRGYIRGIEAHDHPNMIGCSEYEAALKNIQQAKKYGFNLVRFHSRIPSEDFIRAADELGLLVQIELGYRFDGSEDGMNQTLEVIINENAWENTIMKYRTHPSVAIFCIGNEIEGTSRFPIIRTIYETGKRLAPSKLIVDNSGWGEYDRTTSDVFVQHVAYFFPYGAHKDMFEEGQSWKKEGSAYSVPQEVSYESGLVSIEAVRNVTPVRPLISHEAMHYIDVPDYEALIEKFEAFAAKAGEAYLTEHQIKRPRYFTELPELIRQKGIARYMPDYTRASRHFKAMAMKTYLERLRLSAKWCGYEMLQLADTLKYENKNGLLDCFDDDVGYDAKRLSNVNADLVLLAEIEAPYCYENSSIKIDLYASDFLPKAEITGTLTVKLESETIYTGEKFVLVGGLQKLVTLNTKVKSAGRKKLEVQFVSDSITVCNDWDIWVYDEKRCEVLPEMELSQTALKDYLAKGRTRSDLFVTDALTEKLLEKLDQGKTAILFYKHNAERNTWQMKGAMDRFKPCIWDRGHSLGGIIKNKEIAVLMGSELFDLNMQPLVEEGSKVNLDGFPCETAEHILGVDKPVRDRMKGLYGHFKNFIPEDTLRKFSHLFSLKVGSGQLIVCTFNFADPENPVVSTFLRNLLDNADSLAAQTGMSVKDFRDWLIQINREGFRVEDPMNLYWEEDARCVEDVLFWKKVGLLDMYDFSDSQ